MYSVQMEGVVHRHFYVHNFRLLVAERVILFARTEAENILW